ncbi:protein THEMIS2 [Astyanax mexicanus]|uniref:Thymocyte selection associated family member 2 n=1 Tax=Astyanax mexicanus TaxID=7994 RepID=A0A3B1JHP2_ASTMX|nr:protein THEMIS2 [Astyanax mexicanus]
MEEEEGVLALRQYICSLDPATLPRIVQVCSGVYFQGSIYELSGSEVCLSTGDLVKIIGLELLSVCCEDIATNTTFELPMEHSGLFKLVPEEFPYNTIEEMVGLQPVGVDACGSFIFVSRNELIIENFTVSAGTEITLLSVEALEDGKTYARCQLMGQQGVSAEVFIPFSCHGEFYECENERGYSLQEIMLSDRLCKRRFRKTKSKKCGGPLIFTPIYQVQGIMHMRKNIVKFPSSLEVDVIDVTEQCKDLTFVTPLSMAEVVTQPKEAFPTMAEILEEPVANRFFCSSWFSELQKGKNLVLHKYINDTPLVLACTPKGRKAQQYFLILSEYGGQMRRRAREFSSVYELYVAFSRSPGLKVSVTRHCEAVEEEGVPALSVGEQLEVLKLQTVDVAEGESGSTQKVESLICRRIMEDEDEDDDDDDDEVNQDGMTKDTCLPLFTEANFVETISDKKKYCLAELGKNFSLPLEVKVASRDKTLEKDPLAGLTALKLEEALSETMVLASLPGRPEQCFALPINWLQMSLSFTSDPLPWADGQNPQPHLETVIEVTDHFYHEYHRSTQSNMAPPPRPPKRKQASQKNPKSRAKAKADTANPKTNKLTENLDSLSLSCTKSTENRRAPPPVPSESSDKPPPLVPRKSSSESFSTTNTYVQTPRKQKKKQRNTARASSDSDHDYESVEDMLNVPDSIMFY